MQSPKRSVTATEPMPGNSTGNTVRADISGSFDRIRVYSTKSTWAAVRYVERNPVRAGMVARAEDYLWSSARAHCGRVTDALLTTDWPDTTSVSDWSSWLSTTPDVAFEHRIRARTYTGRPCGSEEFVREIEARTGRRLAPGKAGRKPKGQDATQRSLWTDDETHS